MSTMMMRVFLGFVSLTAFLHVVEGDTVIEGPAVTDLPKYRPSLLSTTRNVVTTKATNTTNTTMKRIRECQMNCNTDSDCRRGLLCSKEHRKELRTAGFNVHKVYCTVDRKKLRAMNTTLASPFVCYDPKKLNATTRTTSAPKKRPIRAPVRSPRKPRLRPPVRSPLGRPTAVPPQCPDPTINNADYCDYFALPRCIIGSTTPTCYRTIRKTLANGNYNCKNDEKCYYNKQCRCNSKFGWLCQTIQSVLSDNPNLIESSKCRNPPRAPAAAPVTKVVPVPTAPTPKECNDPIPRPGDKCSTSSDSTCVANQICCRSLKETLSDGTKICNPKTCTYSYGCTCDTDQQQWYCWTAKIGCIDDSECSN